MGATEIVRNVWVGSAPPVGMKPKAGWMHLVLCAFEYQPPDSAFPSMRVHRCNLDDSGIPMTQLERDLAVATSRKLARYVLRGEPVLCTCAQGLNRSSLVAALTILRVTSMPPRAVIGLIRHGRGPRALTNPDFVRLIERAETTPISELGL